MVYKEIHVHYLILYLFKQPSEMNTVIISIFQMEKLRLIEVKSNFPKATLFISSRTRLWFQAV